MRHLRNLRPKWRPSSYAIKSETAKTFPVEHGVLGDVPRSASPPSPLSKGEAEPEPVLFERTPSPPEKGSGGEAACS